MAGSIGFFDLLLLVSGAKRGAGGWVEEALACSELEALQSCVISTPCAKHPLFLTGVIQTSQNTVRAIRC